MQRIHHLLLALLLTSAGLAGCVDEPEEASDDSAQDGTTAADHSRTIIADLPDGTTEVEVDVTAWDLDGQNATRVLVVVENATNAVLTQETFDVEGETTRLLRVNPAGDARVHVTVHVIEGAADLEVEVRAITPDAEPVVIVRERVEYEAAPEEDAGSEGDATGGGADGDATDSAGDADATDGTTDGTSDGSGDGSGDDAQANDSASDGENETNGSAGNETADNETQP